MKILYDMNVSFLLIHPVLETFFTYKDTNLILFRFRMCVEKVAIDQPFPLSMVGVRVDYFLVFTSLGCCSRWKIKKM